MSLLEKALAHFKVFPHSIAEQSELTSRLHSFYCSTEEYSDFFDDSAKNRFWIKICETIKELPGSEVKVLEFGAGRSTFGEFVGELREKIALHSQDITDRNSETLQRTSDKVFSCALDDLHEQYDIIFSTFVWEHISTPAETLQQLCRLLKPGGSLFIVCPRYDFPAYLSPSTRNRSFTDKLMLSLLLPIVRLRTLLTREPAFLLDFEPAVFSEKWFRDADALHWVSKYDFSAALDPTYSCTFHYPPVSSSWKDIFWAYFLILFVEIKKGSHG